MADSSKILFAGGCHLAGFPVGGELSFVRVALRQLDPAPQEAPTMISHINLKSGQRIVEACRLTAPRIVVLQLGHYETPYPFRKVFGLRTSKKGASRWQLDPDGQYRLDLSAAFLHLRKILAAAALAGLGRGQRIFNPEAIAARLDSILAALRPFPLHAILLLSPFPSPDPVTRFCRRRARDIFAAAAQKYGCTFVDTFKMLDSFGYGRRFRENFADDLHLSRLGHQRVANLLAANLRAVLATDRVPAPPPLLLPPSCLARPEDLDPRLPAYRPRRN